jgi:hypothetical protein
VHLVLLLDDSASMTRSRTDAAWRELRPILEDLPAGSHLSLIRFGAEPRLELAERPVSSREVKGLIADERPRRRLPVSELQTDIAAALRLGLTRTDAGPPAVLLLVSDGASTRGSASPALVGADRADVPVLWWPVGVAPAREDVWISDLQVPPRATAGTRIPVHLTLGATRAARAEVTLSLDGQPVVRQELDLSGRAPGTLGLNLTPRVVGVSRVTATLTAAGDGIAENNLASRLIRVDGPSAVLLVSPRPETSPVAASLRSGGWRVQSVTPARLALSVLGAHRVLVLEQLATGDLAPAIWQEIDRAVRRDGLGLVLLGGPGTFGAGAYRHSVLESLLPLIAEAPRPLSPAVVLFAVDKSGSMDRATRVGATRIQLARQAVAGSARRLAPRDLTGLVLFDREVTPVLPLDRHPDPAAAVAAAWRAEPGGGTRLAPLLEHAIETLAGAAAEQRLLVLVSDGRFADGAQALDLGPRLAAAGIDVVALAIGDQADTATLEPLTRYGSGRLLRVDAVAELPLLMQQEISARRSMVETVPTTPLPVGPSPFGIPERTVWPDVGAYPVTRPRPGARVHLEAANGDPLLASHFAGAGRVVALPSGLGPWAPDWRSWSHWGSFLGGMLEWAAASEPEPDLDIRALVEADLLRLSIDSLAGGDWRRGGVLSLEARGPSGVWQRHDAELAAPGRYLLTIPAARSGRYDIRAAAGPATATLALWHQPMDEHLHREPGELRDLAARGLVERWSPGTGPPGAATGGSASRSLLAALALVLYTAVLLAERVPWRTWTTRLFEKP